MTISPVSSPVCCGGTYPDGIRRSRRTKQEQNKCSRSFSQGKEENKQMLLHVIPPDNID
jgi:hypothetical protein